MSGPKSVVRRAACALALAVFGLLSAEGRVLFYPTAVRTEKNLFDGAKWFLADEAQRAKFADGVTFSTGKGGPFSAEEPCWSVSSVKPQPGYWHTRLEIQTNRTYLAGSWVRFPNAKILIFFGGRQEGTTIERQRRLYYFAGFNTDLKPYFDDTLLKRLSDDPDVWKCMFRNFRYTQPLARNLVHVEIGLYLAAGDFTFSHPFLLDVTDAPRTLEIEILESKPVAALRVSETDTRDERWSHTFQTPVTNWKTTLPAATCDAFRGLEQDRPKGHTLSITYADGSSETVFAPLDNEFCDR